MRSSAACHRSSTITLATLVATLWLLGACQSITSDCGDELRSVIELSVFDSLTGAPAAGGATVLLHGTVFSDSLTLPDTLTSANAQTWWEDKVTAGTYSVQVRKPGYKLWTSSDIHVRADACHVTTNVALKALLQR
jgi:hypothetical protein